MAELIYIAFHKPYGVLSQFTQDHPSQKTLADFAFPKDVYPIGRLDKDSEGLLLLTNDGIFKHKLIEPKYGHERVYWAQVENIIDEQALQKLRAGVEIQNYKTRPCKARLIEPDIEPRDPPIRERKAIPTSWLELTLTEGKNRQVRKMTAKVGYPTLRLIRTRIGKLQLAGLELGQWKKVSKIDVL